MHHPLDRATGVPICLSKRVEKKTKQPDLNKYTVSFFQRNLSADPTQLTVETDRVSAVLFLFDFQLPRNLLRARQRHMDLTYFSFQSE